MKNKKNQCGFVGNLDQVWEHGRKEHGVRGTMENERVDGYIYSEEMSEGEWKWIGEGKPITNEKGEYLYRCLESGMRTWRKISEETKAVLSFRFLYDTICIETLDCDFRDMDDPYMTDVEEKLFFANIRERFGETAFLDEYKKRLASEVVAFLDATQNQ